MVIAIVIIGIAVAGVLLVMNYTTAHSADPMIQTQAVAIAESYMEEIRLRPLLIRTAATAVKPVPITTMFSITTG